MFIILLGISAASYLFDCALATALASYPQGLPFFERGFYTGVCFLFTVTLLIGALIVPFYERHRIQ